jgi:hypothetical protein
MSFWTWLFGRSPAPARGLTAEPSPSRTERAPPELPLDDENRKLVHEAVARFEAAGLRIRPELDRDVIAVRFVLGVGEPASFFGTGGEDAKTSPDLLAFLELVQETDVFHGFGDLDAILPKLSALSDDALNDLAEAHSLSIFENAAEMSVVKEDEPEIYVWDRVWDLKALAGNDFDIASVTARGDKRRISGELALADGRKASFEIEDRKRPDLLPFLKAVNALIAPLNRGRFVTVENGSGESFIALYLRPDELIAFRTWAEKQYFADGTTPGNWLE